VGSTPSDGTQICRETAAFGVVAGCVIYVGGHTQPSDEDWEAYLAFLTPLLSKSHATPRIVWDDSGGPSPVNRKKLVELTQGYPLKVAVVSQARTASTVLNWQHDRPAYHDFPSSDLHEAAAFVGLSGDAQIEVVTALKALRIKMVGKP